MKSQSAEGSGNTGWPIVLYCLGRLARKWVCGFIGFHNPDPHVTQHHVHHVQLVNARDRDLLCFCYSFISHVVLVGVA